MTNPYNECFFDADESAPAPTEQERREWIAEFVADAIMASPDVHLHWTHEEAKTRRGFPTADRILAALNRKSA